VTIISQNRETLDILGTYFRGAGIDNRATRRLEDAVALTPATAAAVVLFPDDFDAALVFATLAELVEARPGALAVLITKDRRQFEGLPVRPGRHRPLLLPKAVWGWAILDEIRARLGTLSV
jgi:hypothetical protein